MTNDTTPAPIGADAMAELHALADRIEEARGRAMNIDPSCAAILRAALASATHETADDDDATSREQYKRMFHAACADLGAINEALGLDPDEGGAEPILAAIEGLKARAALASAAQPAAPPGYALVPVEPTDKMVQAALYLDLSYMPGQDGADRAAVYRAMLAAAPKAAPQQEPVEMPAAIEQMATGRYKVVPSHESMFHRWAVVVGTGAQQLYLGREVECQNMARKFAGAFLDGVYVALRNAAPQPSPAAQGDALDAARWRVINEQFVDDYIEDYELIGEVEGVGDCRYTPTETERGLIKDAFMGLLSCAEDAARAAKEGAPDAR